MNQNENEQREILTLFVDEGRDMLDEIEPLLIELEQLSSDGEVDRETLNTIFRSFHSLKGGAGFLNLNTVSTVTHDLETLLDLFRKGKARITSAHIDHINRASDFIRTLFDQISVNLNDEGFEEQADELRNATLKAIEELQNSGDAAGSEKIEIEIHEPVTQPEEKAETVPEQERDIDTAQVENQLLTPELVSQFLNEGEELLGTCEDSLLELENDPTNKEQLAKAFRSFHSFKGNAGLLGFGDLEALGHEAESILDLMREGKINPETNHYTFLLEIIDFLRAGVALLVEGKKPVIPAKIGLINLLRDMIPRTEDATHKPPEPEETEEKPESNQKETVISREEMPDLEEKKDEISKTIPSEEVEASSEKQESPEPVTVKKQQPVKPVSAQKPKKSSPTAIIAKQRHFIRVDVEKLDILLDLVGELVITEAMVTQNPEIQALDVALSEFEKATRQLNKLTRELQDISTSMRMVQLSATFRRMVRLVRDVAQKSGKKVDLQIIGEETEVDKTVIEQINDPLVHLIRNSVDHGIELPEERVEKGKPEIGKLTLEAKYVGNEVWIMIHDDGRGLDREKIVAKAKSKGLIGEDADDLPDEKIWPLIFQPGFSTASKVTDVSGRGVGMDVVKRNIESIRGKVAVRSSKNQGALVTLRIPLTLAIIDGMIVRVGHNKFVVPLISIKESLQITTDQITNPMDGSEIVQIRNRLFPVVRFSDFFKVNEDSERLEDGVLMIVEDKGHQFCLLVDEIIGEQQIVIKGLSKYIGHLRGISGCTILGDGTICLILEIAEIAHEAMEKTKDMELDDKEAAKEMQS